MRRTRAIHKGRPYIERTAIMLTLAWLYIAPSALATPKVKLAAHFYPDLLGKSTTLFYEISISEPTPVTAMDLRLPTGTELAGSSLGLAECQPELLRFEGPQACPSNSIMGRGTALGAIRLTSQPPRVITEPAHVTFALGPTQSEDANPTILILVEGITPTYTMILLTSQLTPSPPPYSYALSINVPLDQMWWEGPYVALMHFKASIGPSGVTYHRREHGHIIAFKPRGLTTPTQCPARGFPFEARFQFYNGTVETARTHAPCPP